MMNLKYVYSFLPDIPEKHSGSRFTHYKYNHKNIKNSSFFLPLKYVSFYNFRHMQNSESLKEYEHEFKHLS